MADSISRDQVQAWLDAYARAWETYDRNDIAALFSEDGEYRWHPADDPEKGRDAIVYAWLNPGGNASDRDAPGTYRGDYKVYAVDGNRAVAVGTSTYFKDATHHEIDRVYYNSWLLEFNDDGECRSFTEYWMLPRGS